MKNLKRNLCGSLTMIVSAACLCGQGFPVPGGSNGSDGILDLTASDELEDTDGDNVFHFTTITVGAGATLKFKRNARNTPIYLLATGDVIIKPGGTIDVSGESGDTLVGGKGGPGGYAGGNPGPAGLSGGRGLGPGGGGAHAAHAHAPAVGAPENNGAPYGGPLMIPPTGGSGGGGGSNGGVGGAGGGGAIVVCSNTEIVVNGRILADAGAPAGGMGSGGGIRLVAPKIKGTGELRAHALGNYGAGGWVRVDTHDRTEMQIALNVGIRSHGSFVVARLDNEPELHVVHVAGNVIQPGANPPPPFILGIGENANQPIHVLAKNFGANISVEVVLKPVNGPAITRLLQIDNTAENPATGVINVDIPANTLLHVEVYKR